jgi:hypothetical protein
MKMLEKRTMEMLECMGPKLDDKLAFDAAKVDSQIFTCFEDDIKSAIRGGCHLKHFQPRQRDVDEIVEQ